MFVCYSLCPSTVARECSKGRIFFVEVRGSGLDPIGRRVGRLEFGQDKLGHLFESFHLLFNGPAKASAGKAHRVAHVGRQLRPPCDQLCQSGGKLQRRFNRTKRC